jgi:Protein of unknown function (DUF2889)
MDSHLDPAAVEPLDVPVELAARGPVDSTPARVPGSVRRTTTLDMTWVDGWGSDLIIHGRGRDLVTSQDGTGVAVADETIRSRIGPARRILELDGSPDRDLAPLVGAPCGSGFRAAFTSLLPDMASGGSVQALMLDDTPGASLISGFAFSRWHDMERMLDLAEQQSDTRLRRSMVGICTGFSPGASSLAPDGTSRWTHRTRVVEPLQSVDDPNAWHEIPVVEGIAMRRARRIDVRREGGRLLIDSMFQDSSTTPEGTRQAVHEYTLTAEVDPATGTLVDVDPVARVLPYAECPLAVRNIGAVVGTPLTELRAVVLERLKGTHGCTHLNDAVRALADVAHLAGLLPGGPTEKDEHL